MNKVSPMTLLGITALQETYVLAKCFNVGETGISRIWALAKKVEPLHVAEIVRGRIGEIRVLATSISCEVPIF